MRAPKTRRIPRRNRAAGFSLIEILIVAGLIAVIAGIVVAGLSKGSESSRAGLVAGAVGQVKTAVVQFADSNGGIVPITESSIASAIPTSGATFGAASATALSNALILDMALLTERAAERAIQLPAGPNPLPVNPSAADVLWDPVLKRFKMNPDATPTRDYSLCNRVECQISSTTDPITAKGSNFRLDGTNDLRAGRRVISAVIPGCPASLAYKISQKIDGDRGSSNETTLDRLGAVVYNTPANAVTDVYIYIHDV